MHHLERYMFRLHVEKINELENSFNFFDSVWEETLHYQNKILKVRKVRKHKNLIQEWVSSTLRSPVHIVIYKDTWTIFPLPNNFEYHHLYLLYMHWMCYWKQYN